jgi:hypothetical protein
MSAQLLGGSFFTNFTVPFYQLPGNYTLFTTCRYGNQTAIAQRTIEIRVPDLNGDNKVNVLDLIVVASFLGWTGTPGSIVADVNRDGAVNILDLINIAKFIGWPILS